MLVLEFIGYNLLNKHSYLRIVTNKENIGLNIYNNLKKFKSADILVRSVTNYPFNTIYNYYLYNNLLVDLLKHKEVNFKEVLNIK